jgi:hypothetical protein
LLAANLNPVTGYLGVPISGVATLNAQIGCSPVLLVSSSYTHWGISPTSVSQNVGPGATVWKTQYENQRVITIDATLLSELSGKYLVCKIVHDDARFTGINLQPKGLASLFVTPPPTDTTAPVASNWNNASYTYPGGAYTISFKATDDVGVSRVQFVLVKSGVDVVTQPGSPMNGLQDFYIGVMTIPADATGTYGIRFEAFDAAGNVYSWLSAGSPSIITTPVYLGGATVTKTGDPNKLALGDVFTCSIGNWANNTNPNTPVSCEWVTTPYRVIATGQLAPKTRGQTHTVTSDMLTLLTYSVRVILRVSGDIQVNDSWVYWHIQLPGGLERRIDLDVYNKLFNVRL